MRSAPTGTMKIMKKKKREEMGKLWLEIFFLEKRKTNAAAAARVAAGCRCKLQLPRTDSTRSPPVGTWEGSGWLRIGASGASGAFWAGVFCMSMGAHGAGRPCDSGDDGVGGKGTRR